MWWSPRSRSAAGRIVKRLGDGLMAVFDEPSEGVDAALEAVAGLDEVEVGGHRPQLRAGLHVGRPRKVGRDYLGVDVNVAARVAEAAGAGEVLVSGVACERLDEETITLKRKRRFKAKGAPSDLEVYAATPAIGPSERRERSGWTSRAKPGRSGGLQRGGMLAPL